HGLPEQLHNAVHANDGATVFGYYVSDPERYGVLAFDESGRVVDIEEKPSRPRSNYAVTGLYVYDNHCVEIAKSLAPSARGELARIRCSEVAKARRPSACGARDITDVNRSYLVHGQLPTGILGRGVAWLDTGTHDSLLQAANFIAAVETRQGLKVCCPEEIAFRQGLIDRERLRALIVRLGRTSYAEYLRRIDDSKVFLC